MEKDYALCLRILLSCDDSIFLFFSFLLVSPVGVLLSKEHPAHPFSSNSNEDILK